MSELAGAVVVVVSAGALAGAAVTEVPLFPAVAVGVAGAGGSTEKSVPVTTVICDPGLTLVGSMAMMTAPERELATRWAAPRSAGVLAA